MQPTRRLILAVTLPAIMLLPGCASTPMSLDPADDVEQRIAELDRDLLALGDSIDPGEARRAARVAIRYSRDLARQYRVSDSALMHNFKVNLGLRERGLCIHWTEDLFNRLRREKFRSLELHWAIANYDSFFRLEHSSVVISARGATLFQGLVLDPWRNSGYLYWSPTLDDRAYPWQPGKEVLARKRSDQANTGNRRLR